MPKATNQAVALVRVSSDRQASEGSSLAAQRAAVETYCQARGLDLVRIIKTEEGVSARKPLAQRPGGPELLSILERGEAQHVIATKLDRLFRNSLDAKQHIASWSKRGVALHLLQFGDNGPIDTASTLGKFFIGLLGELAELESNMTGDRTREVKDYKKRNRLAYSAAPVGFELAGGRLVNGRMVDRRLEPLPAEQATVQRILALRVDRLSYRAIAAVLNTEGVPTKKGGGIWYASTIKNVCLNSLHVPPPLPT